MPFVSVTRLRLRALRFIPAFFFHALRSQWQLRAADGFLAGRVAPSSSRTYWTITLWDSTAAMRSYRNSGAHMRAMPKLLHWCDEAAVVHWEQAEATLPSLTEAARRLGSEGHVSKVRFPSEAHVARVTWPDGIVPSAGGEIAPTAPATVRPASRR